MSAGWGTPITGCMGDVHQCMDTCFCMPCMASRQLRAIKGFEDELDIKYCLIAAFCGVCASFYIRDSVAKKYQIEETPLFNCLFSVCLAPCSSCQVHRELTLRNRWPGGMICHKEKPNYIHLKLEYQMK